LKANDEAAIPKGELVVVAVVELEKREDPIPTPPIPNADLPELPALEEKGEHPVVVVVPPIELSTPNAGFVVDNAAAGFLFFIVVVPTEGISIPVSLSIIPQFDITTLFNGRCVF
jgi:hypothetical protein